MQLEARQLCGGYGVKGEIQILKSVSVTLRSSRVTAFVGSNGAGKTTLMKLLAGLLPASAGSLHLNGQGQGSGRSRNITNLNAPQRLELGLSLVPEGRLVFPDFTVADTLRIGAYLGRARAGWRERADQMYEFFPRLNARRNHLAAHLSGGEQQMLALARSLMSCPDLLLLDEPTLGLAPVMVMELFDILARIRATGVTIGLVEQNVQTALRFADDAYVIQDGQVALSGPASQLLASEAVRASYLGHG